MYRYRYLAIIYKIPRVVTLPRMHSAPGCPDPSLDPTHSWARDIWSKKRGGGGGGTQTWFFPPSHRQYFYTVCVENMTEALHFVGLMRHMFCSVKCNHQPDSVPCRVLAWQQTGGDSDSLCSSWRQAMPLTSPSVPTCQVLFFMKNSGT